MNDKVSVGERQLKFLLYGIGGVYNYGCEGIVRGTVRMLRERWPDCRVVYASFQHDTDRGILSDVEGLEIVRAEKMPFVNRVLRGVKRRVMPSKPISLALDERAIEGVDAVLSIGGDLYTLTGRESGTRYYHPLAERAEHVMKHGVPWVLWGASVGPFTGFAPAENYFARHLRRLSLITVREPGTLRYLQEIGVQQNVAFVADPAFLVEDLGPGSLAEVPRDAALIAVNMSPLSLLHVFGADGLDTAKRLMAEILAALLQINNAKLVLVPHTSTTSFAWDDDFELLKELHDRVDTADDRVILLPRDLGFQRTHQILAKCQLAIAARMHCGINAVSAGTPTIFLGYSHKARSMAQYVYGSDSWYLSLKTLTPEAVLHMAKEALDHHDELSAWLQKERPRWQDEARRAVQALATVLGSGGQRQGSVWQGSQARAY